MKAKERRLAELRAAIPEVTPREALALQAQGAAHDGLLARVLTPEGEPRQFVNIYLGGRNVRTLQGMATRVAEGDVISIVPAVAGGAT